MFIRRRTELIDKDIKFYYKIEKNENNNIKTADIKDVCPHFDFNNIKLFSKPEINAFEKMPDKNLIFVSDFSDFDIKENNAYPYIYKINDEKIKSELKIKEQTLLEEFYENTVKMNFKSVTKEVKNFGFSIKNGTFEKYTVRQMNRSIPKNITKEYILQLAKETINEKDINPKNLKFFSYCRAVPYSLNYTYFWKAEKLFIITDNVKNIVYYDAIVFINTFNDEKIIKFIRR